MGRGKGEERKEVSFPSSPLPSIIFCSLFGLGCKGNNYYLENNLKGEFHGSAHVRAMT